MLIMPVYTTQNSLLQNKLMEYYKKDNNLKKLLPIINGESKKLSLRLIDWFVTNYAKEYFIVYDVEGKKDRFNVYRDYKLRLKAYSKKRFDPFCRWDRINIPYNKDDFIQTTIGQLNFFKWALEYKVIDYIENHLSDINKDMNKRNSTAKKKTGKGNKTGKNKNSKTRKKRQELSISATKSIKKEKVKIVVEFK
tara:strand:- start:376 stop:957 length:582 start_codon:yes stop_codon:yes gene_type:complete